MPQTLISSKRALVDSNTSRTKGIRIPFFTQAFNKSQGDTTIKHEKKFHRFHQIKQKLLSNVNSSAKKHDHCYPLEEDFLEITPRKTIAELKECKEDGDYAVYGTIKGVIGGPDWFVAKCRCGTATFVIFENLGCLLLHKSCTEILKSTENGDYDLTQPSEFRRMLSDRSFIFKVEVKKNCLTPKEPAYDVVDICFNDSVITKFKDRDSLFFYTQDLMSQYNNVDGSQQYTDGHLRHACRTSVRECRVQNVSDTRTRQFAKVSVLHSSVALKMVENLKILCKFCLPVEIDKNTPDEFKIRQSCPQHLGNTKKSPTVLNSGHVAPSVEPAHEEVTDWAYVARN
ncbi:hypothetical protein PIB30_072294 [Stylosanthes scabra]|uniref:Uncharacterized protein n=1 Tax=Stylosanthes scabra TaxID=79078 RepID=A0ABU6URB1_9FABA|nr:hypothetical protein [Stylosanthes scabra]